MTDFQQYQERTRDIQDGTERHVYGKQEYIDGAGSVIKVRGTGTIDEEAVVLNIGGVSFNLPENSNTEVILLAGGSDTQQKMAILTIGRDNQRQWAEGTGGVQHPTDADFALEFNGTRAHVTKAKFAVGENGTFEIDDGNVYIRGNVDIDGVLTASQVRSPSFVNAIPNVPGFST